MLRKILGICIKPSILYNKKNKHKKYKCTRLETYGLLGLVFNTTFNKFQWGSVLLVEENGVHRENHGPATSHWQTLTHNVVSPGRDSKLISLVVICTLIAKKYVKPQYLVLLIYQ